MKAASDVPALVRHGIKDVIAGIAAAVVPITNIVSFGALLFPSDLSAGVPIAIWAMLIGSCIGGIWIALNTSLPPMASGMDSPTVAVLAVLSTIIGSEVVAAGVTQEAAVQSLMLIFSTATVFSGVLLLVVGACQLGTYFRFVPYAVVAGFLAAAGYLLIAGGVRLVIGRSHHLTTFMTDWTEAELWKLGAAGVVLLVLLAMRRWVNWAFRIPVTLLVMWAVGVVTLRWLGLSDQAYGWYLTVPDSTGWSLLDAFRRSVLTWPMILSIVPELVAVVIVSFISLIAKITSIEVARGASGELDRELRAHGIANLIAAPFGGLAASVQPATSLMLEHAGSATRMSGVVSAVVLGLVGIASVKLPSIIPIAIIVALVFYLGVNFIIESLWRLCRQRAWLDLVLALAIMIVCIRFGYLVGVLVGLLCSCVIFAISYARIGVVRGQVTRAQFASYVERSPEASRYLRANGDAIRLYWLSGYLFFGSSEGVFERIRYDIESPSGHRARYVVIDFAMVSGVDSSTLFSITKLRNLAEQRGTTLVYSALLPAIRSRLESRGLLGGKTRHRAFPDFNAALTWCEDQMLAVTATDEGGGFAGFYQWLQHELGPEVNAAEFAAYLECKEIPAAQILYHQGEVADTIDLIAAGTLAIDVINSNGQMMRVRRTTTHTVVGEMGFFRRSTRSATVSAEGPATLLTLSRANFERLRRDRPELASAFDDFIIRVLAERIDFSNRAVTALSHPQ